MLRIGICDDRLEEREDLIGHLNRLFAGGKREVTFEEYPSAEALLFEIEKSERFDLLFLDIYMDGMNGMDLAKKIREDGYTMPIAFLTQTELFALEGYDVDAAGYLMKPVCHEKLEKLIEKVFKFSRKPILTLQSGRHHVHLAPDEIVYAESQDHYCFIHMISGDVIRTRLKLDELEEKLTDYPFLRSHHSYLINMEQVKSADKCFIMYDQSRIPIRTRSRKKIMDDFYDYSTKYA